jgi:hypothetical protein
LIEGGGKFATEEEAAPALTILNPLMPVDYHNDFGVEAIPETEEVGRRGLRHSRSVTG